MNILPNLEISRFFKEEGVLRVILYYALIAFTFLAGSVLILTFRVLPFLSEEFRREIALYTSLGAIFFAGFFLYSLIGICLNPIKPILTKVKKYEYNDSITQIVKKLSPQIGVQKIPQAFITDDYPQIMSYGFPHNSVILIWKGYLALDKTILEAFIAHELWHIKSDISDASFIVTNEQKQISKGIVFGFLIVLLMFLPLLNADFVLRSLKILQSWEPSGLLAFLFRLLFFAIPVPFLLIVLCFTFCSMVTFIYSSLLGFPNIVNSGYREFFADSFGALSLKNPKAMARAIQKAYVTIPSDLEQKKLKKKYAELLHLNFIPLSRDKGNHREESKWHKILKVGWRESHPAELNRIAVLYLVHKLVHEKVSLCVLKELGDISWIKKHKILLTNPLAGTFGRRFRQMSTERIRNIYTYMELHFMKFNLIECCHFLKVDEHDVFTVFIVFLSAKIIDITDPPPSMSSIMNFLIA